MFFRSLFYERTVLSLLERVEGLPPNVQAEIAARLRNYIILAKSAKDEASLARVTKAVSQERGRRVAEGAKSPLDHRSAALALAEGWCVATLGLSNGSFDRQCAMVVIAAIDAFTSKQAPAR
jgi:hypothetical protein